MGLALITALVLPGRPTAEVLRTLAGEDPHVCDGLCMCFASGCSCPACSPVVAAVDRLITDERRGKPPEGSQVG
jgi:hypothetical protein